MDDLESGTVIAITGKSVTIRFDPSPACEECSAQIFCRPDHKGDRLAVALNDVCAEVGQKVKVQEEGNILLILSGLQFGIPLLGLIIAIFAIHVTGFNPFSFQIELTMAIFGLLGLLLGGLVSYSLSRKLACRITSAFRIESIL